MVKFSGAVLLALLAAGTAVANEVYLLTLTDRTEYRDVPFSGEVFSEIPGWSRASDAFDMDPWEPFRVDYVFADGELTLEYHGTEGFIWLFRPEAPLGKGRAVQTAAILAGGELPGFLERDENSLIFEETSEYGAGSRLLMNFDGNRKVISMVHLVWSP